MTAFTIKPEHRVTDEASLRALFPADPRRLPH